VADIGGDGLELLADIGISLQLGGKAALIAGTIGGPIPASVVGLTVGAASLFIAGAVSNYIRQAVAHTINLQDGEIVDLDEKEALIAGGINVAAGGIIGGLAKAAGLVTNGLQKLKSGIIAPAEIAKTTRDIDKFVGDVAESSEIKLALPETGLESEKRGQIVREVFGAKKATGRNTISAPGAVQKIQAAEIEQINLIKEENRLQGVVLRHQVKRLSAGRAIRGA